MARQITERLKRFFRVAAKVCAAAARGSRVLWIRFWRALIVLIAKFLSGASVRWVESQPDRCQRIYFANHTSHLDSIVIWSVLPEYVRRETRMVAALDYWSAGPFRRFLSLKVFNAILIDRKHVSIRNNPINQLLNEMGNDHSIIIFPEGGRGNGEKINDFKSGIFHLAKKKPEIELIPIYLDNMNRILPRGMVLPVPMLSRVVFGPPIWIEKGEKKEDFLERCREAVLKLKDL